MTTIKEGNSRRYVVSVMLNDEETKFVKWLADRDGVSVSLELKQIFYTELFALMDLYGEEMRMEEKDG